MKKQLILLLAGTTLVLRLPLPGSAAAVSQDEQQRYWSGYHAGRRDAASGQRHQWTDEFIAAGYRRGIREGAADQAGAATPSPAPSAALAPCPQPPMEGAAPGEYLPLSGNQQQFLSRLAPSAQRFGRQYDLYPSVLLAQAALESNWGHSDLATIHHNLFGIKALPGQTAVNLPTLEAGGTGMVPTSANFCHYPDDLAALAAYARLLDSPIYARVHRRRAATYREATRALTGVFATDPHYDQKLNHLIEAYQLTSYDHEPAKQENEDPRHPVKIVGRGHHKPSVVKTSDQTVGQKRVHRKKLSWYWWPVSMISGGSLTWLVDFLKHRPR